MQNNKIRSLVETINMALNSENNDMRSNAQMRVIQQRDSNPSQFFLNCSLIVNSEQYSTVVRQSAATVCSRLVNMPVSNIHHQPNEALRLYWDEINPQVKQQIKHNSLAVLISPIKQVMKAGAQIVAVIASIQLPRYQWENIIDLLAKHCSNNDQKIKNASILTLGSICQQIKASGQKINDRLSEQILGSILCCCNQNDLTVVQTSLKALQDSLSFLQDFMNNTKYRDAVFNVFVNNFRNQIELQNTYRALYEFVKAASPFLMNYLKALTDLTELHLERRDQVSILNLELWDIIGSEHAQNIALVRDRVGDQKAEENFLQKASGSVLQNIMKCLLIMNKNQIEDQELRLSAARAIQAFTKVCSNNIVDLITTSASTIITSEDPHVQQATVILFSTISEYHDKNYTRQLFASGFQHLFQLLNSSSQIVVKNSLIGFIRLAECLPDVFLSHPNISEIVDTIMGFVNVEINQIRYIAIQILTNVSEGLKETPQPVSDNPNILLTKIVKFYSQNMQKLHRDQPEMNEKLISIIMNIVMNTNKRDVIVQLIEFMIEEYYKVNNNPRFTDIGFLVEQILSVLHTAILSHKNAIPNNDILSKCCDLISFHIKKYGAEVEGLNLLGALATTFNKNFQPRSKNFWPVIMQGLSKVNETNTFKASLSCIGDYARMMQSSFFNHANDVMKKLLHYINNPLDRQMKVWIISCIGDLILSIKDYSEMFIDDILGISDICFQAVYEMTSNNKDYEYVEELKSNLIEMYSCLVFSSINKRAYPKLFNHYGNLATFIVRTCDKNVHPTVEYLKSCLYLLHDSAAFFWNWSNNHEQVKKIIDSKQVQELVHLIERFSNRPDIKELLDFINARKNMTH